MNKKAKEFIMRVPDPFDGSADARLVHMGLLDRAGKISGEAMNSFVQIFSGLFYDDLCDFHDDAGRLAAIHDALGELAKKWDYQHMLLFLSLQYDYMRKPLPDPVWWLSGNSGAVGLFMEGFFQRFHALMAEAGILPGEAGEEVAAL